MSEELVEKVARELWCQFLDEVPEHWAENGPHGPDSILAARASIGVVLDAVRERVEKKAQEWDAEAKRDAAFPDDQRVDLAHAEGLREAISGLSIDSLGAEGGNPE